MRCEDCGHSAACAPVRVPCKAVSSRIDPRGKVGGISKCGRHHDEAMLCFPSSLMDERDQRLCEPSSSAIGHVVDLVKHKHGVSLQDPVGIVAHEEG
jgi:hypothetical protein